jgi:hypothetical protein
MILLGTVPADSTVFSMGDDRVIDAYAKQFVRPLVINDTFRLWQMTRTSEQMAWRFSQLEPIKGQVPNLSPVTPQ